MKNAIFLVLFTTVSLNLDAHDMWIEPSSFFPESGEIDSLRLKVGQDMLGDPLARESQLIKQFVVLEAGARKPVMGREGADPAGFVRASQPGLLVVGYHSNPSLVEETAEKFNQYLKEEGLDAIAALRAQRNETGAPVRELFTRCAKTLLLDGPPNAAQGDHSLGFTLELLAERNPFLLRSNEDLPLLLTYENRPLAGALVIAMNKIRPTEKVTARTGIDGRVKLRLHPGGMWMIKAVHMIPARTGANGQWQSYWASLTFEIPAAATTSGL